MGVFGSFETTREIAPTAMGSISLARPKGANTPPGKETHVVKVRNADPDFFGEERAAALTAEFLGHAKTIIDASPGGQWGFLVPIYDSGPCPEGAFIVTDHEPRSLRVLVASKVPAEPGMLAALTRGVVGALRQLGTINAAHGNLKPANVFFSGEDDLPVAKIRVDDPKPGTALTPATRAADLFELGKMIFLIVVGRPLRDLGDWPVQTSPDWQKLLENEPLWRRLCHDLLNPEAGSRPDLDEIEERLKQGAQAAVGAAEGQPQITFEAANIPKKSKAPLFGGIAAGVLVLGGAGLYFAGVFTPEKQELTGPAPIEIVPTDPQVPEVKLPSRPDPRPGSLVKGQAEQFADQGKKLAERAGKLQEPALSDKVSALAKRADETVAAAAVLFDQTEYTFDTEQSVFDALAKIESDVAALKNELASAQSEVAETERRKEDILRAQRGVADNLAEVRNDPTVLADAPEDAAINVRWRTWRDELLASQIPDDDKWQRILDLEKGLKDFARDAGDPPELEGELGDLLRTEWRTRFDKALNEVPLFADLAWRGNEESVKKQIEDGVASFNRRKESIERIVDVSGKLIARIQTEGYGLTDNFGGDTPESAWAGLETDPILNELMTGDLASKAPTVKQAADLIARLRSIAAFTDASAIEGVLAEQGVTLSQASTAWSALARALPVNAPADFDRHAAAAQRLRAVAAAVGGDAASRATGELDGAMRERWTAAIVGAPDLAGVGVMLSEERRSAGAVNDELLAALPAPTRYNVLLHAFNEAINAAPSGGAARRALPTQAQAFVSGVRALGGDILQRPGVSDMLSRIEGELNKKRGLSKEDIEGLALGGVTGWSGSANDDATRVTFTRGQTAIEFAQVKDDSTDAVAYVQTTELSIGQALAIIQSAGAAGRGITQAWVAAAAGSNIGPRGWAAQQGRVTPSRNWVQAGAGVQTYPPGLTVPPPSDDVPLQGVPPSLVAQIAGAARARLPREREWLLALSAEGGAATVSAQANLRDAAWNAQYQHFTGIPDNLSLGKGPINPLNGVFGAPATPAGQTPAVDRNDGVLWFAPVNEGPGTTFRHLIGNVAEFVFADDTPLRDDEPPTGQSNSAALGGNNFANLRVIGGSALSAGDLNTTQGAAITGNVALTTVRRNGFSDVGFRLACPGESLGSPLAQDLRAVITQTPPILR